MPHATSIIADSSLPAPSDQPTAETAGSSAQSKAPSELRIFSAIVEAIGDLPAAEQPDEAYVRISENLRQLIGWDSFAVLLLDSKATRLDIRFSVGLPDQVAQYFTFGLGQALVGRAARDRQTLVGENAIDLLPGNQLEMAVPLLGRDRVLGVMSFGRPSDNPFSSRHKALATEIGRHLGRSIESSCAHSSTRRLTRNLSLLQEAGRELTSILDRQLLLERIASILERWVDHQLFSVHLWDEESQRLDTIYARRSTPSPEMETRLGLGEGLCGTAAALRQTLRVDNVTLDPRFVDCGDPDVRSALVIPLLFEDRLLGVLNLESHAYDAFSAEHEQMLSTLASSIAVALTNAELYERSRRDERRLQRDLETAREVQRLLLPRATPWLPGVQLAVANTPSRHLGGDVYDFIRYGNGRTALIIGDVAGKGTAAALYGSMVLGALRGYVQQNQCSPACVLSDLHDEIRQLKVDRRFVAMTVGLFDHEKRTLEIANAGLPYPLLMRGEEVIEQEVAGLPLGALERPSRAELEIQLQPGDVVVFATDGIDECLDRADQPFGSQRVAETLRSVRTKSAEEIASALIQATDTHLGTRRHASDDRTVVVLKVTS